MPATHHSPLATQNSPLRIVIVGHVDHGKSSLIGRLFYETGSLPEGKFEAIKNSCEKRGMPFEWSFLLDALQAERDQGITIDTTQIWFKTPERDYVIIDAPGHKEFLKNMISGAASADAAILLIDAKEGIKEQSKRHGYLLHLLGIKQIAVAVNKMDLVDYLEDHFQKIKAEYTDYLNSVGVEPTVFIPISAREGANITTRHTSLVTHHSILEALAQFHPTATLENLPLRFPVQDVYKFDERRILAGRIESGSLQVGDEILFSPSNKTTKIASLECWPDEARGTWHNAHAGESIGITLRDPLFIERGEVISHVADAPLLSSLLKARIIWLSDAPLVIGKSYKIKLQTAEYRAEVQSIDRVLDTDSLENGAASQIERHQIGEVTLRLRGLAALDDHTQNPRMGRFVIIDGYDMAGGGIISLEGIEDQRAKPTVVKSQNIYEVAQGISTEQRIQRNGHLPAVLWLTGLSGSGKSTISQELQTRLFAKGYQVVVLDGDNVRHGLCSDLGFAPEDRSENIRRVGEVAALFARAGFIVITAFISPYIADRKRARAAAPEYFHSIYVKADVETCEKRDAKGLYAKARRGEIKNFTGIDAPYEPPQPPDLVIDTNQLSIEESVAFLMKYVDEKLVK